MRQPQSNPCLVVTNPLHFTYLMQAGYSPIVIGSSHNTLTRDYAEKLNFPRNIDLYPVHNNLEDIILARQSSQSNNEAYITWKAVDLPYTFLGNSYELCHKLERKAFIRSLVPGELFPEHKIIRSSKVKDLDYQVLAQDLGTSDLVLQIDFSTGGKGTYFIDSLSKFAQFHSKLVNSGQDIVVSRRVQGSSFAVQCLIVGKQLKRMDWWHQDLVNVKGICNLDVEGGRYCGAVLQNIPHKYLDQVDDLAKNVADVLVAQGYQGIFGMDIVVEDATNKVYLIEVNPRFTAVSHMYATAMRAVGCNTDFLTLTVIPLLEPNRRLDTEIVKHALPNPYFYFKLQNTTNKPLKLQSSCKLGVYNNGIYQRFGFGIGDLNATNEIVVIPEGDNKSDYDPGHRIFSVIGQGSPLEGNDLNRQAKALINQLFLEFAEEA